MPKLQYVQQLLMGATHHIDLAHLITEELRPKQSQMQNGSFEKRTDDWGRTEKETFDCSAPIPAAPFTH